MATYRDDQRSPDVSLEDAITFLNSAGVSVEAFTVGKRPSSQQSRLDRPFDMDGSMEYRSAQRIMA